MPSLSADFKWPAAGKPSSVIIQDIHKDKPADWDILLPHESIRFLINEVRAAFKNFNPTQEGKKWQAACLGEWLKGTFHPIIHWHHTIEDNFFQPGFEKRGVVFKNTDQIVSEHETIHEDLERITNRPSKGFNSKAEVDEFMADFEKFAQFFEKHMEDEERDIPDVIKAAGITPAQSNEVLQEMLAQVPVWVQGLEFPCIVYNMHRWYGTTEEIQVVLNNMGVPGPVIFLLNYSWIPHFYEDTIKRFECLKYGDSPYTKAGCLGC